MLAKAPTPATDSLATRLASSVVLRGLLLAASLAQSSGCTFCRWSQSQENLGAARQLTLRGAEAMQRGNALEAERCLLDAIAKHPLDERCHVLLAELRKRQGRESESTEHLERAVEISGDDPQLLTALGVQLLEQDQPDEAMRCVRKALRSDATSAEAWVLYARLLKEQKKTTDAVVAFHRALQIDPFQREVALELAETYLAEGRLERCISTLDSKAFSTAESIATGEPDYLRGIALARMDRHEDATVALAEAERRGVRTPELYYQLAQSHHQRGAQASARLALSEAQRLAPGDARFAYLADELDEEEPRVASDRGRDGRTRGL